MLTLDEYLRDPCGTLSIPYWKSRRIVRPAGMRIVHNSQFSPDDYDGYRDAPYFRLLHQLEALPDFRPPEGIRLRVAEERDFELLAQLLNVCYGGLQLDSKELSGWTESEAYCPALWLLAEQDGQLLGAGIADLDPTAGEGSLEWIQVMPQARHLGIGRALVSELLRGMVPRANFATVSGRFGDPSAPEALYRSCGFTGNDIWHILRRQYSCPDEPAVLVSET